MLKGDKPQNSIHSIDNHNLVCCEEHWNRFASAAATSDLRIAAAAHLLGCNNFGNHNNQHRQLSSHVRTTALSQPFLFKKFTEV